MTKMAEQKHFHVPVQVRVELPYEFGTSCGPHIVKIIPETKPEDVAASIIDSGAADGPYEYYTEFHKGKITRQEMRGQIKWKLKVYVDYNPVNLGESVEHSTLRYEGVYGTLIKCKEITTNLYDVIQLSIKNGAIPLFILEL